MSSTHPPPLTPIGYNRPNENFSCYALLTGPDPTNLFSDLICEFRNNFRHDPALADQTFTNDSFQNLTRGSSCSINKDFPCLISPPIHSWIGQPKRVIEYHTKPWKTGFYIIEPSVSYSKIRRWGRTWTLRQTASQNTWRRFTGDEFIDRFNILELYIGLAIGIDVQDTILKILSLSWR